MPIGQFQVQGGLATGCPRCGSASVHQPTYTWWGGILGPKLFNHTICNACGFGFNAKTGQSNTGPITIYFVVITVIAIAVFGALAAVR